MAGAIKRKTDNGGARHSLDKFYTKDTVALGCITSVKELLEASDIVVEPSAGGGAFSRQIQHPNLQAYDLEPEDSNVTQADWFSIDRAKIGNGKLTVIGNPPFGVRADLAKRFIKKSVDLEAETIAFLLPRTFSKALNQQTNLIPETYRLVTEDDIPDESFTLEGGGFHIPCRWYVWTKNAEFKPRINLRKQLLQDSPDFKFMPRGDITADFTINGNSGKVKSLTEVTNPKAEHYIRVADRAKVAEVKAKFASFVFDFNSSVNGGVAWVGKQEILVAYQNCPK